MHRRRFLTMSLAFASTASFASEGHALAGDLLRSGKGIVYFRHGATTWSGIDRIEWPRSRQRLLSDKGIEQSRQIGKAFRAQGFEVGEIIASPFARCRDMAEIAFGRVEEDMRLIGLLSDSDGPNDRRAFLKEKLTGPVRDGRNRVIVSHRSNIAEVAGVGLEEGEGVVIRPTKGSFEVLGQFMPDDWMAL